MLKDHSVRELLDTTVARRTRGLTWPCAIRCTALTGMIAVCCDRAVGSVSNTASEVLTTNHVQIWPGFDQCN